MIARPDHRTSTLILLAILLGAFGLRFAGLFWGIPLLDELCGYYHPDEPKVVTPAIGFPEHVVTNRDLRYPTLYGYLLGILSFPLHWWTPSDDAHLLAVHVFARGVTIILGTGAVWLTCVLGRRLFDAQHGLLAAGFVAVAFYHVQNSAWATTDVASSFMLLVFLLIARPAFGSGGTLGMRLWAGVALGALVSTKYPGAVALVAVPVLLAMRSSSVPRERPIVTLRHLIAFGLVALVTLLVTTPGIVLFPAGVADSVQFEMDRLGQSHRSRLDPSTWRASYHRTTIAMGWPFAAASLLGLAWPWNRSKVLLIAVVASVYVGFGDALKPRYLIMVMPCLALCAAHLVIGVARLPVAGSRWIGAGIGIAILASSAVHTVSGIAARYPDSRTQAAHFIRENVADGTTVGVLHISPEGGRRRHPWQYPKIDLDRVEEVDFLEVPEVLIVSSFDLVRIVAAFRSGHLRADFSWPEELNHWWYRRMPPTPEMFRVYDSIVQQQRYLTWASFVGTGGVRTEFGSPDIHVLRRAY